LRKKIIIIACQFFIISRLSKLNAKKIPDGPGNVFWVDAKIIEEFKPDGLR
jgi:hypothetical protein